MFDGTFYLTKVDDKYRRFYAVKDGKSPISPIKEVQGQKTEGRLNTLEGHFTTQKDEAVLRTLQINFHKKPL